LTFNLGIPSRPINVFCDNKPAISLIKSGAHNSKDKHIYRSYHYIQDIVEKCEIKVKFISSIEMIIDPMTKGLPLDEFRGHVATTGLKKT
jgi:hypothetical protein